MIDRRALIGLALLAGLVAALIYNAGNARAEVVVVSRDVAVPRPLVAEDLEIRTVAAGLAPDDALSTLDAAIGLVPRTALAQGQVVLGRSLAKELSDFRTGTRMGPSERAVAIPVDAVAAVGGSVVPGARIDVLAVPVSGRAPAGRTAELLLTGALVLDVRGESGAPFVPKETRNGAVVADRIASVVIAIAAIDEVRIADRIATSTFVLALAGSR